MYLQQNIVRTALEDFPFAEAAGSRTDHINTALIRQKSKNTPPLTLQALKQKVQAHYRFLEADGGGGKWQVFVLKGLVFSLYSLKVKEGQQATFEYAQLPKTLDLSSIDLPFANFCAVHAPFQNFANAILAHSLFTDAFLTHASFENAELIKVDFSRADLSHANFRNANLSYADFENCDLSNADFRGATLRFTNFAGATLHGVKR